LKDKRVIMIGLDGATWEIINQLSATGILPTFKNLLRNGVHGNLKSCIPPVTFPAWKCLSTGKRPEKLGVFWWSKINVQQESVVFHSSLSFNDREIWDYLEDFDYTSGIIGMPTTYPPKRVNGFMISEYSPKEEGFAYPKGLEKELKTKFNFSFDIPDNSSNREEFIRKSIELIESRFKSATYLMKKFKPDFLNITIFHIDPVQHFFYGEPEVAHAWEIIDEYINKLIQNSSSHTNFLFVSDHGFSKLNTEFNLENWLIKGNMLHLKNSMVEKIIKHNFSVIIRTLYKVIKSTNMLNSDNLSRNETIKSLDLIDFKKSEVIPSGDGLIYLNDTFFNNEKEKDRFLATLKESLLNIKDPESGKKLCKEIIFPKKETKEKLKNSAPDIIILPHKGFHITSSLRDPLWNTHPKWRGWHQRNGIFLAYGNSIKKGKTIKQATLYDIAPTILHIFGLPIPNDMDGRVLTEIFEEDSELAKRKPRYVDSSYYEKRDEREKIKEEIGKLKKLGRI